MSTKTDPQSSPTAAAIVTRDPLWAIAAVLPVDALQWCKKQFLEDLREEDFEVVSGRDGFTAMLAYAEVSDIGESTALELSAKYETATYLLDFNDEAEFTRQYHVRVQRPERDPAAFLKSHGIGPGRRAITPCRDPDPDDVAIGEMARELLQEWEARDGRPLEEPILITDDPQWAIAAALPVEDLEWCQHRLPWPLCDSGSQLVAGKAGFSALLGYGGSNDLWLSVAVRFSELFKTSTYLLELGTADCTIRKLDARARMKTIPPVELLSRHGIEVFVAKPLSVSWRKIGVVDGVTLDQAREQTLPGERHLLHVNKRGVLVDHDCLASEIGDQLKRASYVLYYDTISGTKFFCTLIEPGKQIVEFAPEGREPSYQSIDSILGETTLDGILRVLDIPRDLLLAEPADRPLRVYIEGRLTLFDDSTSALTFAPKAKPKAKPRTKSAASARKPRRQSRRARPK